MKKYILPVALCMLLGFSSCDDSLDLNPKDKVSEADYFKTAEDLELFSNPYYNNMLDKSPYDEDNDYYVQKSLSAEQRGGNYRTIPNSGSGWSWGDLRRINSLLARVDRCPDEAAVIKYTALSRMFRAFFYFEKVKRFGNVPWYDKELGSSDPDLYKTQDSRELVMSNMIDDIDYAIEFLPDRKDEPDAPYRATKWAALALKAQFCLFEGTYRKYHGISLEGRSADEYLQLAADAAKELIEEGPYKLYSTNKPDEDYLNMFAAEDANKDEYILAIRFSFATKLYHNATAASLVASQGRPGFTRKAVNMYLMKDGTQFTDKAGWQEMQFGEEMAGRDPRLAQTVRCPGYHRIGETKVLSPDFGVCTTGYSPVKFVQNPKDANGGVDRVETSTADLPVYRLAEVMLNYAEAKAELGTLTQDDLDMSVNLIRKRAGMPDLNMAAANANPDWYLSSPEYGYTNVTGANKGVILEIRRERSVELMEEGFRWSDVRRWKAGYCYNQSIQGMYFPGPGEYDLSGNGKTDLILYASGSAKPAGGDGVQVYEIGKGDGKMPLSDGNRGYVDFHYDQVRPGFNEQRDYLYPVPSNEIALNPNLIQNPGWGK